MTDLSFHRDIRPLFRGKDVDAMSFAFGLADHEQVGAHAEAIYERLADGTMPCDAPWPDEHVQRIRRWIAGGAQP